LTKEFYLIYLDCLCTIGTNPTTPDSATASEDSTTLIRATANESLQSRLAHERNRVTKLHQYQLLNFEPTLIFDDITQLAAQICDTPVALITLVDDTHQWFKSRYGCTVTDASMEDGFCPFVVERGKTL
jgi:hypothetical protein